MAFSLSLVVGMEVTISKLVLCQTGNRKSSYSFIFIFIVTKLVHVPFIKKKTFKYLKLCICYRKGHCFTCINRSSILVMFQQQKSDSSKILFIFWSEIISGLQNDTLHFNNSIYCEYTYIVI